MGTIRIKYTLFLLFFILISQAQNYITVRKPKGGVTFYQVGEMRSLINNNKGNVFVLVVNEARKPEISIQIENAQLIKTEKDSLVKLKRVVGVNYECVFEKKEGKSKDPVYEFKTFVNGASTAPREMIIVKIYDKVKNELLMTNVFYYQE